MQSASAGGPASDLVRTTSCASAYVVPGVSGVQVSTGASASVCRRDEHRRAVRHLVASLVCGPLRNFK